MKQFYSTLALIFIVATAQAQTTGPTQPEAVGFTPIGADNMVDLYSGDLNYNLPIMELPGPDGMTYPINIFYNSNVGMDQAASWVGLGWNLNVGAILRDLRGIPDDFNGEDKIKKTVYMKPSWTISFKTKDLFKKEIIGLDMSKLKPGISLYYNNYNGIGLDLDVNVESKMLSEKDEYTTEFGLSFSNQEGFTLQPSISFDKETSLLWGLFKYGKNLSLGSSFNSSQGFKDISFSYQKRREIFGKKQKGNINSSFSSFSPIQNLSMDRFTTSSKFGFTFDGKKLGLTKDKEDLKIEGKYIHSWVTGKEKGLKAIGSLYLEKFQKEKNDNKRDFITDYYRENDGSIHKKRVLTPIPVQTYDLFTIQGHGVGGNFRLHENSFGIFSKAKNTNTTVSAELTAEVGIGKAFKIGGEYGASYYRSYSGKWKGGSKILSDPDNNRGFKFLTRSTLFPLYEPNYFMKDGEQNLMFNSEWEYFKTEEAIAFNIKRTPKTKVWDTYNRYTNTYFTKHKRDERSSRKNNIEYFKKDELALNYHAKHIIIDNSSGGSGSANPISYTQGNSSHINGITVRNDAGVVYNYWLPAYNTKTVSENFTIPGDGVVYYKNQILNKSKAKVIDEVYSTKHGRRTVQSYADSNNNAGDEYYSKEEIPAYAHTYFITSILSQDYVDLTNNGPTEDDLGTYIKFNYTKIDGYQWRFPHSGYYYAQGYIDNEDDDKASVRYGTKDLFYVRSIESKTHIIVFNTIDAKLKDANNLLGKHKAINSIALFSKSDPKYKDGFYYDGTLASEWPTPIQTAHFDYDYELKPETPNSDAPNNGTLTLKELFFTYQGNKKGSTTPYKFKYGKNIAYQAHQQDRWGSYQPDFGNSHTNENPYTYQYDYPTRHEDAAAWLLNEITLPSKGKINIDYEKDDYAYVQDKVATNYVRLIGAMDTIPGNDLNGIGLGIKEKDTYLIFESPTELLNNDDVKKLIDGIDYMRFRVFLDLRKKETLNFTGPRARDYVEGYAKLDKNSFGIVDASRNIAYIKVKPEKARKHLSHFYHPFRLAGFQYLRHSRSDLGPDYNDISNMSHLVFFSRFFPQMLSEVNKFINGYYFNANLLGYAGSTSDRKPSYIRLNNPKAKYGDGVRVKKITLTSNDINEQMAGKLIYGQEYEYKLKDGKSSGVAEYEPMVGSDETPQTLPVFFGNDDKVVYAGNGYLAEEPLGAGLFPGAKVGYSRVVVRNLQHQEINKTQSGVNVTEFYTAKDFPTRTYRSGALMAPFNVPTLPIPFIGTTTNKHNGFSMGYTFVLNSGIYGQQKSVATFPYSKGEPTGEPIQKSVYIYQTQANNSKALDNYVDVLFKEGQKQKAYLGKTVDFYVDEIENSSQMYSAGLDLNISMDPTILGILPMGLITASQLNTSTRMITTNKIIHNNPILEKVEQYKDGAKVTTSNLVYDAETGDPIINSVTNEWEKPVYTYNLPAHWSYENMKGAYRNYRSQIKIRSNTNNFSLDEGLVGGQIPNDLLREGDVLMQNNTNNTKYYASNINYTNNTFDLKDRQNNVPSLSLSGSDKFTIIQSGYKNLQTVKKGKIVSLEDLSTHTININNVFVSFINNYNIGASGISLSPYNTSQTLNAQLMNFDVNPCSDSYMNKLHYWQKKFINSAYPSFGNEFNSFIPSLVIEMSRQTDSFGNIQISGCEASISNNVPYGTDFTGFDVRKLRFNMNSFDSNSNSVFMEYMDNTSVYKNYEYSINLSGLANCLKCEERTPIPVLHADAIEFSDDEWDINYSQLESQTTDLGHTLDQIKANPNLGNPYAFGMKGIWKPWRTSAYLEKRKQTNPTANEYNTKIDKDGEFDFYWFDWEKPISYNEEYNWRWVNEVTQYNPNGHSKEGRNRLDIHAASLFGYKNNLVTASASNAKVHEIAFDGFEDNIQSNSTRNTNTVTGNLKFYDHSGSTFYNVFAHGHTGNNSLGIAEYGKNNNIGLIHNSQNGNTDVFTPIEGKTYVISFWTKYAELKRDECIDLFKNPTTEVEVKFGPNITTFNVHPKTSPIEGWYRVEGVFTAPAGYSNFQLRFYSNQIISQNGPGIKLNLIDDIRIQPLNSGMETYVYDPKNYRLTSTLSNQNMASFYIYDEEGSLVGTKIETEEGIKSISTNRNNIKQ